MIHSRLYLILLSMLCLSVMSTHANLLHRMDLITNGHVDRIIFEFDRRADYHVDSSSPGMIQITFDDVKLDSQFTVPELPSQLAVIDHITPNAGDDGTLVLNIVVRRESEPSGTTLLASPWTYAMDIQPIGTPNQHAKPRYIPGDRPFPTRFAGTSEAEDHAGGGIRFSAFSFALLMLMSFLTGVAAVFATGYGMQRWRRNFDTAPAAHEALQFQLERDLNRLKRAVQREQTDPSQDERRLAADRERLILKMVREGRQLDAIAAALEMTPDQVRTFLDQQL